MGTPMLEVMRMDGSVVKFHDNEMRSALRLVKSEISAYVKEIHGAILYTVFNSENEEFIAIECSRDRIVSPIVYITPIIEY